MPPKRTKRASKRIPPPPNISTNTPIVENEETINAKIAEAEEQLQRLKATKSQLQSTSLPEIATSSPPHSLSLETSSPTQSQTFVSTSPKPESRVKRKVSSEHDPPPHFPRQKREIPSDPLSPNLSPAKPTPESETQKVTSTVTKEFLLTTNLSPPPPEEPDMTEHELLMAIQKLSQSPEVNSSNVLEISTRGYGEGRRSLAEKLWRLHQQQPHTLSIIIDPPPVFQSNHINSQPTKTTGMTVMNHIGVILPNMDSKPRQAAVFYMVAKVKKADLSGDYTIKSSEKDPYRFLLEVYPTGGTMNFIKAISNRSERNTNAKIEFKVFDARKVNNNEILYRLTRELHWKNQQYTIPLVENDLILIPVIFKEKNSTELYANLHDHCFILQHGYNDLGYHHRFLKEA
ncbi:hypothetical protein BC829DRAFT_434946 [Chytridium lagenaria]|nr:hypothetical protein BC829DRAFT_437481 [Chytridium lagenaria]KAI8844976.1 hypothetical protein BC829DRAFT_434946 [Chytridium lagenaria]